MESFINNSITTTVLVLLATGLGYIVKRQHNKIREIQSLLYEKKYGLYSKLYSLFFDIIKAKKSKKPLNESSLSKRIIDIKMDLLIYAPDHIVSKFIEWHQSNFSKEQKLKSSKYLFQLYSMIRKDMGYPKSKIEELEILKIIMGNPIEVEQMRSLIDLK